MPLYLHSSDQERALAFPIADYDDQPRCDTCGHAEDDVLGWCGECGMCRDHCLQWADCEPFDN